MTTKRLTVGFADLTHYAKLVESSGDQRAFEHLQEAFRFVGDALLRSGGTIRKYIGDALLFSFEDPKAAAAAAREIASYVREVNGLTLQFNVALATGDVLLARVGHPSYLIDDILGQTVNRAAILIRQARNSPGRVAMCEETRKIADY